MNMLRSLRRLILLAALNVAVLGVAQSVRADDITDDMVGQDANAWTLWQKAVRALERDEKADAEKAFEQIAALKLSDLRLALMGDRTGSIQLEQWSKSSEAPTIVKGLVARIAEGRKQKALAEDGWHFAAIGRFQYADANFKALLDANPDPVGLLELARQNPNRHTILVKLLSNNDVGPSAKRFLQLLDRGEDLLRQDPNEIVANVRKLGGPPRMNYNATNRLKAAGEYAIPHLLQYLSDPKHLSLHPAINLVLPQIGRAGLNPMCVALGMKDNVAKQELIEALAKIGYRQPLPYLAKLAEEEDAPAEVRATARQAIEKLARGAAGDRASLFMELAENYWNNIDSVQADPRNDTANVWYLRDGELRVVAVPTAIFNDIMAMRCCEEALKANPNKPDATALWLAANFRREGKLGLDVESDKPDPLAEKDGTRPENYPRSIHFARAAGAKYNHLVLARAVKSREPGVALGAIAALAQTAGEPSLVGAEDVKQPLVQSLSFPNRQVRVKAALAIGRALPKTDFSGAHNVVPVLAEALSQSGGQSALVVDPDQGAANKMQAALRAAGFDCAVGESLYQATANARKANISTFDVIFLATSVEKPDVAQAVGELRKDALTSATPIVIVAKEGEMARATGAQRLAMGVEIVPGEVTELGDPDKVKEQVMARIDRAARSLGMNPLSADMSLHLALQAADVLRLIGESGIKTLDISKATGALITALKSKSELLRTKSAHALALHRSPEAQKALAEATLDTEHDAAERIAVFGSLAESARRNGNLIGSTELVAKLIEFTMGEKDLVLRAAGSQALGALDLPSNKASEIIRAQYRG